MRALSTLLCAHFDVVTLLSVATEFRSNQHIHIPFEVVVLTFIKGSAAMPAGVLLVGVSSFQMADI